MHNNGNIWYYNGTMEEWMVDLAEMAWINNFDEKKDWLILRLIGNPFRTFCTKQGEKMKLGHMDLMIRKRNRTEIIEKMKVMVQI